MCVGCQYSVNDERRFHKIRNGFGMGAGVGYSMYGEYNELGRVSRPIFNNFAR